MPRRSIPSSLRWLAVLVLLAIASATLGIAAVYLRAQQTARTRADLISGGSWRRGQQLIAAYGCGSCHVIAGIAGANGMVGPDLSRVGIRADLAGRLANDPDAMVRWIMHPQAVVPGSGMPEKGVTAAQARDMAAYLYARERP